MPETQTLSKTYVPSEVEREIYRLWLDSGAFDADPDERPRDRRYVIMMPLPNVTGALHMGHAMDNGMQDLLIRWHRMMGDNALWMPGTDHAGIATQAVVEKRLKELEGLTRHDIGRDQLVERIWQWKDQYQARIVGQQQKMGCSCDWRRQRFTMDDVCARAVRTAFFALYRDGLIARGKRLVNWDAYLQTTISDDEVYHETVQGHFWYVAYPVIDPRPGEPARVVVATTRPETMLGDTAVAVHPDPQGELDRLIDQADAEFAVAAEKDRPAAGEKLEKLRARRAEALPGLLALRDMAIANRTVLLPLLDRPIPLILDEWARPELGTGCVKITPAHDPNDHDVWTRHRDRIGIVNLLEPDGTYGSAAGPYAGMDRFVVRERVIEDLEARGLLVAVEDREIEIGHSDRSKTPIEPYLSDQWFVLMGDQPGGVVMGRGTSKEHRSPGLVQAAIDAVTAGRVSIHPQRYARTCLDWLAEKRDWPVSRQLWWGHRIPVWSRRFAPGDVDLAGLRAIAGEGMLVRLQAGGDEGSVLVDPREFDGTALDRGVAYRVDVCLLADEPARVAALEAAGWVRDPDVLDTWFSSALWPFSTLGWPDPAAAPIGAGQAGLGARGDGQDCLAYYFPGSCLVTGRDIITLWVARMVLAGLYNLGDVPFSDVFIHANILDGNGMIMSKSKGNGIDPVDIIGSYGTDAMRYVLCDMQTGTQDIRLPVTAICPTCGHHNDLACTRHGQSIFTYLCGAVPGGQSRDGSCGTEFDVLGTMPGLPAAKLTSERFEVGRAFCTKLWNSARFVFMNLQEGPAGDVGPADLALEDRWLLDRLDHAAGGVQRGLLAWNPSVALGVARDFFWSDLCDWYLEVVKGRMATGGRSAAVARAVLAWALDQVLRLLHPFVPFITEHLWQILGGLVPRRGLGDLATAPASDLLIRAAWPKETPALRAPDAVERFGEVQAITRAIREFRSTRGIAMRQPMEVTLAPPVERAAAIATDGGAVARLVNLGAVHVDPSAARPKGAAVVVLGDLRILLHGVMDETAERARLERELGQVDQEIAICDRKLENPAFVRRAPASVVEQQQQRRAGFVARKDAILAGLEALE